MISIHQVQQMRMPFSHEYENMSMYVCTSAYYVISHSAACICTSFSSVWSQWFDRVTDRATISKLQIISSKQAVSNFIVFVNGRDSGSSRGGRRRWGFLVCFKVIFKCFYSYFVFISPCLHFASTQILWVLYLCAQHNLAYVCVCWYKRNQAYTCMHTLAWWFAHVCIHMSTITPTRV